MFKNKKIEFLIGVSAIGLILLLTGVFLFISENNNNWRENMSKKEHEKKLQTYKILMGVGGGLIGLVGIVGIYMRIKYKRNHKSLI